MLNVYWANAADLNDDADLYQLSAYRREKLERLKPTMARKTEIGAELLLIHALRQRESELTLPLKIACDENGKPSLAKNGPQFNLSHSGCLSGCAIAETPIGFDLQIISAYNSVLARRCFTPEEQMYLSSSADTDLAFTRLWCRKESFLKAIGLGLRLPLSSFCASPGRENVVYNGIEYAFYECCLPGACGCVCVQKGIGADALRVTEVKLNL